MGKRGNMAQIHLDELRHLDHPVFGNLQIVRQSPKLKESFSFPEKPSPENRKFSKTMSDNSMVSNRQRHSVILQRSDSLNLHLSGHFNDAVCNNEHQNDTRSATGNCLKQWLSAEFPTKRHRNNSGSEYSETNGVSSVHRTTNGRDLCRSTSNSSSISASDSEDVPSSIRNIRNASNFHRSMSLSRGSSIEEESENGKGVEYRRRVSNLVDELLLDIYGKWYCNGMGLSFHKRRHSSSAQESDCCSTSGGASTPWKIQPYLPSPGTTEVQQRARLSNKGVQELTMLVATLRADVQYAGAVLTRQLKRRDALLSRQEKQNDVITAVLQAMSEKRSQDTKIRYSVMPYPGDSGFTQWHEAMKMVARLPGGIPPEFRRRLWLTLAEKHLQERGVDWNHAERFCFNEWSNPDDDELGVQIVKDLHRTGCSLFCGAAAEENQALLKRVLLAYARWNKAVGYCQGFNMLAALILQVMDRSETDSVKVMIYLIEGVLPESYFANNLRGLSVDMAVFRDLLRLRLPTLSRHLEQLQHEARDSATGTSYEPPLTNVFTMQWFLTLFSNCLPQSTVLRVWDLIFLEGNEVLLRTALAIWDGLADRIMAVDSADEFYSIMGVLTREMLEFGLMDTNNLIKTIVTIAPFPFPELPDLRDRYLYNITPWTHTVSTAARRGLKLFHSDDDDDEGTDEDDEKIAVAATYGISAVFRSSRRRDSMNRAPSPSSLSALNFTAPTSDRDRLVPVLDISALKQQYVKLRERQRQAHIILTAACARQPLGPSAPNPVAMNHLLLGKTALLSVRGSGPPPGAVPPPRNAALKSAPKSHRGLQQHVSTSQGQLTSKSTLQPVPPQKQQQEKEDKSSGETLHWKDAARKKQHKGLKQDTIIVQETETASATGIPVIKEPEADKKADNDSEDSKSSTSTELCDEPDRLSDFDSEEPTSISDASSYAASAAEQAVIKIPSPIKSGLPTPETVTPISPMKDEVIPVEGQSQISVSPSSKVKHLDKLSPVQLLDKSVPVVTDTSDFISTDISPIQESLSPSTKSWTPEILHPDVIRDISPEIVAVSLKSPVSQIGESKVIQTEGILISDSFVLKLPSPLKESVLLKKEQISPCMTEDIPLNDSMQDLSFKEREIVSPKFSKDIISISPISPETISPKSPEKSDSESSSLLVRELSSFRSYSPVKTMSEQDLLTDETITEEFKDTSLIKMESLSSEDLEKLDSDTSYTKQYPLLSPMSDISPLAEETVEDNLIDWFDRSPIKIALPSIKKSSSTLDIIEEKVETLQSAKSAQNLKHISPTERLDRFSLVYSDRLSNEVARTTRVGDIQEIGSEIKKQVMEILVPDIEVTSVKLGGVSDDSDDNEKVSKLLELNQRLHERVRSAEDGKGDEANKLENEIDYEEMKDLLKLDPTINLGRRNSERALQIIQENSEILQRIMLCQARRPSKLSEEESNGGTTTIPSEAESMPTSSSAENVDITTCQIRDVSSVDESDIPVLTSVSPVHSVLVEDLDEVSVVSPTLSSSQIVIKKEKFSVVSPEKQLTSSDDISSKSWKNRDYPVKDEIAEKDKSHVKIERPYSFSSIYDDSLTALKSDSRVSPVTVSTRSFTLSPEMPSKQDHRFSLDYGDMKFSVDSRETEVRHLSSDDTFSSFFEDKPKYTGQFDDGYKEIKTQKFELDSDSISTRKRFDELDIGLGESTSSQFPRHFSPETTIPSSYSSVSSKTIKDSLDFFDTPLIIDSGTRPLSSSRVKWSSDNEYKTEKHRDSPSLFDSTVSKYPYDSISSSSWLTEKSRREHETSPVKSFENRPTNHYSDVGSSKPYTSIGRYDYSFTRSETRSSDTGKTRDTHSPIHSTKDSSSHPLNSFSLKTSFDRSDKSSIDDYQQKLSYSPTRKYIDDSMFSIQPSASLTAEFSNGTQDVIRRSTARAQTRPHSTIISDLASMEVLNRSYSSSSIDGYVSESRIGLKSSGSPEPGKSSFSSSTKLISDETSTSPEKSRSMLRSPIYEFDSTKKTPLGSNYRHLSPRRDEFDSKLTSKDSSPPRYSSFSDSNWDKDVYSSPSKSQYRKSPVESERLKIDISSTSTSTSLSPKLGKPYSPPTSPSKSKDINIALPPIKSGLGSPVKTKSKFDPFPPRPTTRQPKELGIKLGLYSPESSSKNGRTSESFRHKRQK